MSTDEPQLLNKSDDVPELKGETYKTLGGLRDALDLTLHYDTCGKDPAYNVTFSVSETEDDDDNLTGKVQAYISCDR